MTAGARRGLRVAGTLGVLALLAWRIEPDALAAEFETVHAGWAAAALALTVPQVMLSAWRWRLTASHVGLRLPLGLAIREYYLATFLNQVLPGGVLGDANRAWRHARADRDTPAAWHAVVIERVSGQLTLALVAIIALALAPELRAAIGQGLSAALGHVRAGGLGGVLALVITAMLLAGLIVRALTRRAAPAAALQRFARHVRRSLLGDSALAQFASSLGVVATYIGVFLLCARMLGLDTPLTGIAPLIPPLLLAMAVPLSIAGWGLREGAAALVWMAVGLPAAEGVALSLAYGVIVLISSLPGALVLLARQRNAAPA